MRGAAKSGIGSKLLEVRNLEVEFDTYGGIVKAVRGVDFSVDSGKTLAIVGESGCGKSVTVQSMMGLIPIPPGRITSGSALLRGQEVLGDTIIEGKEIRGAEIGMIFQDPMPPENSKGYCLARFAASGILLISSKLMASLNACR